MKTTLEALRYGQYSINTKEFGKTILERKAGQTAILQANKLIGYVVFKNVQETDRDYVIPMQNGKLIHIMKPLGKCIRLFENNTKSNLPVPVECLPKSANEVVITKLRVVSSGVLTCEVVIPDVSPLHTQINAVNNSTSPSERGKQSYRTVPIQSVGTPNTSQVTAVQIRQMEFIPLTMALSLGAYKVTVLKKTMQKLNPQTVHLVQKQLERLRGLVQYV